MAVKIERLTAGVISDDPAIHATDCPVYAAPEKIMAALANTRTVDLIVYIYPAVATAPGEFSAAMPTAVEPGTYKVWYTPGAYKYSNYYTNDLFVVAPHSEEHVVYVTIDGCAHTGEDEITADGADLELELVWQCSHDTNESLWQDGTCTVCGAVNGVARNTATNVVVSDTTTQYVSAQSLSIT